MNVDRARFLMLTTALSAATAVAASVGGCTVTSSDAPTPVITPGSDAATDGAGYDAYYSDSSTEDGGACLDDTGAAPSCTGAQLGCDTVCNHYTGNFKTGVAREIASCIVKLPSCESPAADNDV